MGRFFRMGYGRDGDAGRDQPDEDAFAADLIVLVGRFKLSAAEKIGVSLGETEMNARPEVCHVRFKVKVGVSRHAAVAHGQAVYRCSIEPRGRNVQGIVRMYCHPSPPSRV